jgi:hypothetical protein
MCSLIENSTWLFSCLELVFRKINPNHSIQLIGAYEPRQIVDILSEYQPSGPV